MKLCNINKDSLNLTASHITEYSMNMTKTGTGLRTVERDATQHLLESLNTNSFSRIRSALQVPCLDLNYRDPQSDSQTFLTRICRLDLTPRSRCDLMKMVLEKPGRKIDVNSVDCNGMSALAHACKSGDDHVVRLLAGDDSVDPNIADTEGNTPLIHACRSGNKNVVNTLMTCFNPVELKINQPNHEGLTPLMVAARQGFSDVCRVLVSQGHADVSLRSTSDNFTAKDYAIDHGRCHTPELLLLDSVAQRKVRAREARKAMGRSILNDFCPEIRLQRHGMTSQSPFDNTAQKLQNLPLSKEYIDQMNSIVFQVGRTMERLAEDLDGETRETVDDEAIRVEVKKSKPRRMSVQIGLADKGAKLNIRRRSLPNEKGIKLGTSKDDSSIVNVTTSKAKSIKPLKLPRVARTARGAPQNLSTSPTSPPAYTITSPRRTPTSGQTSAPVIKAVNRQYSGKGTGNWAGKSSTSVPSYLFR